MYQKVFIFFLLFISFFAYSNNAKTFTKQEIIKIKNKVIEIEPFIKKSRRNGFILIINGAMSQLDQI